MKREYLLIWKVSGRVDRLTDPGELEFNTVEAGDCVLVGWDPEQREYVKWEGRDIGWRII